MAMTIVVHTVLVYETNCAQLAFRVTSMLTKAISNMHKAACRWPKHAFCIWSKWSHINQNFLGDFVIVNLNSETYIGVNKVSICIQIQAIRYLQTYYRLITPNLFPNETQSHISKNLIQIRKVTMKDPLSLRVIIEHILHMIIFWQCFLIESSWRTMTCNGKANIYKSICRIATCDSLCHWNIWPACFL